MDLGDCRVVLVRPKIAANVGAAARVMRNMGLSKLVLVAPRVDPQDRRARRTATRGEGILDRAVVVETFGEAVADCVLVVGTSARVGGPYRRQSVAAPWEVMPGVVEVLRAGRVALVFGPEPSGLTDHEVAQCHHLIHIPADPGYPALNLAHAVAVCLYELRRGWLQGGGPVAGTGDVAAFAEQERVFAHLREALEAIHFVYGPGGGPLMHAVRHLVGRAQPTRMEVGVLHGLARQILWWAREGRGGRRREGGGGEEGNAPPP